MHRSLILLGIGGGMVVAGFIIIGIMVSAIVQEIDENVFFRGIFTLEPLESREEEFDIVDPSQPFLVISQSTDDENQLIRTTAAVKAEVVSPTGEVIASIPDTTQDIMRVEPTVEGQHLLRLTNLANEGTQVLVQFAYASIPTTEVETLNQAGLMVGGGLLIFAGIVVLVAGGIIFIVDRRKRGKNTAATP